MIAPNSITEVKKIINENNERDVLVFKHSTRCGISAMIKLKFDKWVKKQNFDPIIVFIDVIANRELSNQIEKCYKIMHETPQLIWFRKGNIIWHGSHFEISNSSLNKLLSS